MITEPAPTMNASAKFDRVIDAVMRIADSGSIEGTFSYEKPDRPSGRFSARLDGVEYYVTIVPQQP